jgi:hypothetical protein
MFNLRRRRLTDLERKDMHVYSVFMCSLTSNHTPGSNLDRALSIVRGKGNGRILSTINKLRAVKPSVRAWQSSCCHTRRDEVILTRLRTGHTRLTHGFLLRGDAPVCAHCDSPLSVVHILIDCPVFQEARDIYINSMAPSGNYCKTTVF